MKGKWLERLKGHLGELAQSDPHSTAGWEDGGSPAGPTASIWRGLTGRSPELAEVQEELAADQMGRVALVSRLGEENAALLARLRGDAPTTPCGQINYEGFFTLVHLPPTQLERPDAVGCAGIADEGVFWSATNPADLLQEADLLLYLIRAEDEWSAADAQWIGRLRAGHAPLLPVLTYEAGIDGDALDELRARLRARLGIRPATVARTLCCEEGASPLPDLLELVECILSLRPRLAIPLAQQSPVCRAFIARRVIHTGAWMSGLLGLEPMPLLDLPLHVAVQWKVAMQLAAIYGRPGLDVRSREMMSTLAVSVSVRFVAQQLIKLVPVVGWLLSGVLSGASTWLLGAGLARYYEEEHPLAPPNIRLGMLKDRVASCMRAARWRRGSRK